LRLDADAPASGGQSARVLEERAAWYVASILAGAAGPSHVSPGTIAFKTGTSYGYRDAWAIGFDGAHVVGVWAGRPDGRPVPGLVGIDAAAPVMMDAFARLGPATPLRAAPPGVLQASTSSLPATLRNVRVPGREIGRASTPEIAFPPAGVRLDLGLKAGTAEALVLKARNGRPPYIWLADGAPVARAGFGRSAAWTPAGPGYVRLTVIDADGGASTVGVYLE
jgi:penicillin-binding protein 1C